MQPQQTIDKPVTISGPGLFNPQTVTLTIKPAPANHGIVFLRTDLDNTPI
ncbi:MAG: UDP-3-O-acyl-N-acetylglucosamine deacetylase, partial [Phycisphaeraceae bacterium]